MKLQRASVKEVQRMAVGCCICCVLEMILLGVLAISGFYHFTWSTLIGAVVGTLIAIVNFVMMCLMVQNAVAITDEKLRKAKVQGSYNLRILIQAGWGVLAFVLPFVEVISAVIPLLFPTAVIWFLQTTGNLFPDQKFPSVPHKGTEEEIEDKSETFET